MKKILLALIASLMFGNAAYAQNTTDIDPKYPVHTGSFWSNWYVQGGLEMTLQNPCERISARCSPKEKRLV